MVTVFAQTILLEVHSLRIQVAVMEVTLLAPLLFPSVSFFDSVKDEVLLMYAQLNNFLYAAFRGSRDQSNSI
jgi:hypothetical protein